MREDSGFMLLEVILSVLVIASGIVFVINSYSTSLRASRAVKGVEAAALFADEKLFELDIKGEIEQGESGGRIEGAGNNTWHLSAVQVDNDQDINAVNLTVGYAAGKQGGRLEISTYIKNKKSGA